MLKKENRPSRRARQGMAINQAREDKMTTRKISRLG